MPKRLYPPTPASSMEISPQDRLWPSPADAGLHLPPPAILSGSQARHASPPSLETKDMSLETSKERKPILLPSPPSRTRKIIQMKPPQPPSEPRAPSVKRRKTAPSTSTNTPSTPSAASKPSKKTTRKTAHSLIERRRRSKMNTAFATLREMIPACRTNTTNADHNNNEAHGTDKTREREMHKLDVLNAGIEYIRYLEGCLERFRPNDTYTRSTPGPSNSLSTSASASTSTSTSTITTNVLPASTKRRRAHEDDDEIDNEMPPSPPPSLGPRPRDFSIPGGAPLSSISRISRNFPQAAAYSVSSGSEEPIETGTAGRHEEGEGEDAEEATQRTSTAAATALMLLTAGERRGNTTMEVQKEDEAVRNGRVKGRALRVRDLLLN